jgi:O-antigen/teichoic acid export membrane protein
MKGPRTGAWLIRRGVRGAPAASLLRAIVMLAGAGALGQAVLVLAAPVLTRLYTPDDLGALAVFAGLTYVLGVMAPLRFETAIPVPTDDTTASHLLVLAVLSTVATSVLCALGVWLLGDAVVRAANVPVLAPFLWLLPLSVLATGLQWTLNAWAVRRGAFTAIARGKVVYGVATVATQVGLGLVRAGTPGLLLGAAAGPAGTCALLARRLWRWDRAALARPGRAALARVARRFVKFPLLGVPGTLIDSVGLTLPMLLLAVVYGPQVVGWFALAQRVAGRPLEILGDAVAQVFTGAAARLAGTNPAALPRLLGTIVAAGAALAGPYAAGIALLGPAAFPRLFGPDWAEAGQYARALSLMVFAQAVASPTSAIFDVLQRQDLYLAREVMRMIFLAGAIAVAVLTGAAPGVCVLLLSLAGAVAFALYIAIAGYAITARPRVAPEAVRVA